MIQQGGAQLFEYLENDTNVAAKTTHKLSLKAFHPKMFTHELYEQNVTYSLLPDIELSESCRQ